ncbi:hemerythrin domain-containing protein [Parafrankia discariae]|uniref:hemerythrin domain-containing protein n=1 Tax=Parafrankia discariae TaxID=365528 RepID=UPI000360B8B2|nr:hemerythrin domain-containing protein [Parafrankia discariae]
MADSSRTDHSDHNDQGSHDARNGHDDQGERGTRGDPEGRGRSLAGLVHAAHRDASDLLDLAGRAQVLPADPRQTLHASDVAVAAFSAHLSVMESVVYPQAARLVPRGRARTAALRGLAREAAAVMRGIEQYVQGDLNRPGRGLAELRADLTDLAIAHARAEDQLLDELESVLSEARRRRLRTDFERAMRRAPTRPHPHLGHGSSRSSRLAARAAGHWDHLLDTMDARAVAGRPIRAPAPAGLWGWYLLGRPTADQPPREPIRHAGTTVP